MTVNQGREFRQFLPELASPERGHERMERFYALPLDEQQAYWETLRRRIDSARDAKGQRSQRQELPADIHTRLLMVDASTYVRAIAGADVEPGRRICCPLPDHDDDSRDFTVYSDHGWRCFGCNRGGNIYNLASFAWNTPLSGQQFKEVQERLYGMRLA